MDNSLKHEDEDCFGICKCCLQTGNFKNLWEEYIWDGERQICGQLIAKCFALELSPSNNSVSEELICDPCIDRLRDASNFKAMIMASHEELKNIIIKNGTAIKSEEIDDSNVYQYDTMGKILCEDELPLYIKQYVNGENGEYEEVEFLEEEPMQDVQMPNEKQNMNYEPSSDEDKGNFSMFHRRRGYTKEQLFKAINQVRNKELKLSQAAVLYNIPKGTLKSKIYNHLAETRPAMRQTHQQEKQRKLIKELQSILSYTNAIPFKVKTGKFYCAYCTTDGPFFDSTDTLRIHTVTEHSQHRVSRVPRLLKPVCSNEIAKLDVSNLICTACYTPLLTWNDMFEHMKQHGLDFDEAYRRIVPFLLGDRLKCALCNMEFYKYNLLDTHMNCHYSNHICQECGDTFLTYPRLVGHLKLHDLGRYPCEDCGKVFTLDKYRVKHRMFVHDQEVYFKCLYCPEKFKVDYARHTHMLEKHSEKVKTIECECCGKLFTWRPYYLKHLKRKHRDEKEGSQSQDQD